MVELKFASTEEDYESYKNRQRRIHNEKLRDSGQSFSDAMCDGSIVVGLDNGEEILELIRKAGG